MGFKDENFKPRIRRNYNSVLHVKTPKKGGAWRLWFLLLIFLLLLGGSVYLLFFSDYFRVKEVVLEGATEEMETEINEMLTWETDYMIMFDANTFSSSLLNRWEELADVKVTKVWPCKLEVLLIAEVPKLVWNSDTKLFLINSAGIVLGRIEEDERLAKYNDLSVVDDLSRLYFEDGDKVVSRDFIFFVDSVKSDLENSIKKEVEAFEVVETTFELRVKMREGYSIYFDALRDPQTQVEKLNIFFKGGLFVNEYVDLRVPGRVYYK